MLAVKKFNFRCLEFVCSKANIIILHKLDGEVDDHISQSSPVGLLILTRGFKSLHWVAFLNIRRILDFRIHLSNLIKKGLHGSAFSFSIYQVKK